jgi:RNA polymerase sigma-70 factor (ECF subfamily)
VNGPSRTVQDDVSLAARCTAGNEDAWQEFLRTYRTFMIEFARRIVGDPNAADLVDHVIADLWQRRKLAAYEGRSSLRTWLGAVIGHAALNARRAWRVKPALPAEQGGVPRDRPSDLESAQQFRSVLFEAIRRLPRDDRALLLLHYEQDLTLEQASRVLGSSKSTLSRQLARARQQVYDEAVSLAREMYGESMGTLWHQLSGDKIDFDLRAACASGSREENDKNVSNL